MQDWKALTEKLVVEIKAALEENEEPCFDFTITDLRYATRNGMSCVIEALFTLGYTDQTPRARIEEEDGRSVLSAVFSQLATTHYVECLIGGYRLGLENGKETLTLDESDLFPISAGELLFKERFK